MPGPTTSTPGRGGNCLFCVVMSRFFARWGGLKKCDYRDMLQLLLHKAKYFEQYFGGGERGDVGYVEWRADFDKVHGFDW